MTFERARVSVVVPAYQEAGRIRRVLETMPPFVDQVIVIDDASTDGTREAALEVRDARVLVVSHEHNRGVGAAIATGYARALEAAGAPCDAICVMAGDGQMDPADLAAVVSPVAQGIADYVKGNRFGARGLTRTMPLGRIAGGLAFSWLTARAIGRPVHDSQCGYTAIARDACARLDLDDLWPRFGYPNDLLGQVAAREMRIVEVPVRPVYHDETSGLGIACLPRIGWLVGRAWVRRVSRTR